MAKPASLRNVHFNNQAATLSSGSRIEMTEKTKKLADGILDWNRRALSRAITLVESRKPEHNRQAELLLDYVLEQRRVSETNNSNKTFGKKDKALDTFRLGIAGPRSWKKHLYRGTWAYAN